MATIVSSLSNAAPRHAIVAKQEVNLVEVQVDKPVEALLLVEVQVLQPALLPDVVVVRQMMILKVQRAQRAQRQHQLQHQLQLQQTVPAVPAALRAPEAPKVPFPSRLAPALRLNRSALRPVPVPAPAQVPVPAPAPVPAPSRVI